MADSIDRPERLAAICRHFGVDILYAFGSRGREAMAWQVGDLGCLDSTGSDLDVGVLPAEGEELTVMQKVDLAHALEDLFELARVDLVCLRDADPFLAANIIRGERLFAVDEYRADEYDLYVLRRAGDLAPLERERLALIFGEEA
jgi:predicted nucleotidyltransferase